MSETEPSLSWSIERRIDRACDSFEADWRDGRGACVEDFLSGASAEVRSRLLAELVALEIAYRVRGGERPDAGEYLRRFADEQLLVEPIVRRTLAMVSPNDGAEASGSEASGAQDTAIPDNEVTDASRDAASRQRPLSLPAGSAVLETDFGDYVLLEELGEGGMGVVYRARQNSANRIVALKLIRPDRLEGVSREQRQEVLERFRSEARAAARLEHDHILPLYEVGEIAARPFYSMRYIDGQTLTAALREGPLDSRRAARCLEAASRAVDHAHQHGLLHRDIKPGNILLDADDRPYVTDFGMAKWVEGDSGMTRTGAAMGTPSYMSPEQAQDASAVSPASDVYCLGATLYAAVTGRPPFQSPNPVLTMRQVAEDEPVPPRRLNPIVDRDLETICLKCLDKEPRRRYRSAAELANDLRRWQDGEPIVARRNSLPRRLVKWARRRPALAGLSAATLVALLVLLGVWLKFTADLRAVNVDLKAQRDRAGEMATLAGEQQVEARQQQQEAERQKNLAIAGLRHARETAGSFYHQAANDPELRARGLESFRAGLLEKNLELQEKLLAEFGHVPDLAIDQAEGYRSLGYLHEELQNQAEAVRCQRKAVEIAEQYTAAYPDEKRYRGTLGVCLIGLGDTTKRQGNKEEAEAAYRRSIDCFQELLARDDSRDANVLHHLADAYDHLGIFCFENGRWPECEEALTEARALLDESLAKEQDPGATSRMANVVNNLGYLYLRTDRVQEAEPELREAIKLREGLHQQFPDDPRYLEPLTVAYRNLALLCQKLRRDDEALTFFAKAIERQSQFVEVHPKVGRFRTYLANHCYRPLGDFHRARKQFADAAAAYRSAAGLLSTLAGENPQDWSHVNNLATCLLRLSSVTSGSDAADLADRLKQATLLVEPWSAEQRTAVTAESLLTKLNDAREQALRLVSQRE